MSIITTSQALKKKCKQLTKEAFITVDTEFLRDVYYFPKLCLIQIASLNTPPFAVDTIGTNIDLTPLFAIFKNKKIIKVFHSSKQDLEILTTLMGQCPLPVFDTQIAAMLCGFGYNTGYATLASEFAGVTMDKTQQYTNWSKRPLTHKQIVYALADVEHLIVIYQKILEKLQNMGRLSWAQEEMGYIQSQNYFEQDDIAIVNKLKLYGVNKEDYQLLKAMALWREKLARKIDIPRQHLLKDSIIYEIIKRKPKNIASLKKIRGLGKITTDSVLCQELLNIITTASDNAFDIKEYEKLTCRIDQPRPLLADMLFVLRKMKSEEYKINEKLIAPSSDIEKYVKGEKLDIDFTKGWRQEVFCKDAKALIAGKKAITTKKGRLTLINRNAD